MKILNLYPGIGGNRKDWGDQHQVTAVEIDPCTAEIYRHFFPNDIVVVGDAHQYLIENYMDYDFIWTSPPCPTHSRVNYTFQGREVPLSYPDMKLYEEIIFLSSFFKGNYVVENVIPYYKPLIKGVKIHRHLFWTNVKLTPFHLESNLKVESAKIIDYCHEYGFDLSGFKTKGKNSKLKMLRNCVHPKLGKHILDCSLGVGFSVQNSIQLTLM